MPRTAWAISCRYSRSIKCGTGGGGIRRIASGGGPSSLMSQSQLTEVSILGKFSKKHSFLIIIVVEDQHAVIILMLSTDSNPLWTSHLKRGNVPRKDVV